MDLQKLNILHERYLAASFTDREEIVRQMYDELMNQRLKNGAIVVRSGYGDEADALSLFNETLAKVLSKDSVREFGKTFAKSLKNARIDFFRKEKRRRPPSGTKLVSFDESRNRDDDTPMSDILIVDEDMTQYIVKKKEANQRQLVDFLLESARTLIGSEMTAIISELPNYDSVTALAKAYGLNHTTVNRSIAKLTRFYSEAAHGDISDYLPDGFRVKRQYLAS